MGLFTEISNISKNIVKALNTIDTDLSKKILIFIDEKSPKIKEILEKIDKLLPQIDEIAKNFVSIKGHLEKILDSDEPFYEFAARYMEGRKNGVNREDFENYEDFKEALDKEIYEVPEIKEEEKLVLEKTGRALVKNELDLKAKVEIPETLYAILDKLEVKPENIDLAKLGEIVKEYDLTDENINGFQRGTLSIYENRNVEEGIVKSVQLSDPEKNKMNILDMYYEKFGSEDALLI